MPPGHIPPVRMPTDIMPTGYNVPPPCFSDSSYKMPHLPEKNYILRRALLNVVMLCLLDTRGKLRCLYTTMLVTGHSG